jgi:P pilus assembly chaperone PapD
MLLIIMLTISGVPADEKPNNPVLAVSTHHLDLVGSKSQDFITVKNHGGATGYVKMQVHQIQYTNHVRQRIAKKDPRELGLLVTPSKLILKPGQSRKVRIKRLAKGNQSDLIYEVNAVPVDPPGKTEGKIGMSISITMVTFTRVVLRPDQLKPDVKTQRDGKIVRFENQGNTTVLIKRLQQCVKEPCEKLYGFYLLPGMQRQVHLTDASNPLTYDAMYLNHQSVKTA